MGHPQQVPLWWKIATARSFILNRGIVADTKSSHAPGARVESSAFHSTKAVVSQVVTLAVKVQCFIWLLTVY